MHGAKVASAPLAVLLVLAQALGEAACISSSDGIRVAVVARQPGTAQTSFVTDRGYTVALDRAYACIGAIEIRPCAAPTARRVLGLRSAHAHGTNTATKLTTPAVIDLLGGNQSLPLGELSPPPSAYCSARVSLLAADDDALGLSTPIVTGRSVLLEGRWSAPAGSPHELRIATSSAADSVSKLGLDLREPKTVTLVVGPEGRRWFDGIDFASEDATAIERQVVAAIAASMVASVP